VAYLEVISKVVPKIWARMNSAMVKNYEDWEISNECGERCVMIRE
jgi:hypothetical protein